MNDLNAGYYLNQSHQRNKRIFRHESTFTEYYVCPSVHILVSMYLCKFLLCDSNISKFKIVPRSSCWHWNSGRWIYHRILYFFVLLSKLWSDTLAYLSCLIYQSLFSYMWEWKKKDIKSCVFCNWELNNKTYVLSLNTPAMASHPWPSLPLSLLHCQRVNLFSP